LIQEVEKPKEDFISRKDSNYSQFDLSKLDSLNKKPESEEEKIRRQMLELEAERKALFAQTQRIAEETRLAKENLDKANADYAAAKKEA
jgi:hypothetical protein